MMGADPQSFNVVVVVLQSLTIGEASFGFGANSWTRTWINISWTS